MKVIESILTKNPCYKAGKKITVKGLMLHSVGCPQPKASVFINSWNSAAYNNACVHAFIDGNSGDVYQTLPWNHRGWHCGSGSKGSGNNTHIGVEMCEPACVKYTGGSSFSCSDKEPAKAVVKRTYQAAVELFADLCEEYNLDPLADGVILSHKEGYLRGIASNHGDPEHLWNGLGMGYTMNGFRKDVKNAMAGEKIEIAGNAKATASQMEGYIKSKNAAVAQSVIDMIPLYISEGKMEGIRGDIAFAQSCLETGNFTFKDSAVTLDQNNFCGMGVTSNGMRGNSFETVQLGIRAQIQHLKAYANSEALKNSCVDPRFEYVKRGSAQYVEWLGIQENPQGKGWASGAGYGDKILNILAGILKASSGDATETVSDVLYRVQVGAYSKKQNADVMLTKVKKAGFETCMVKSGGLYKIQVGAYSKKQNADAMLEKVKKAGFDAFITKKGGQAVSPETKKTVAEIAKEVIQGKWGNGEARKAALKKAGYDPNVVQKKVNELLK